MRVLLGWALLATAACVGDSSVTTDSGATDSSTDVTQNMDAGGDAIVDSAPPCDATACGASCVDLATDSANCGACGHSCGAGTCVAATCQPYAIQTGLNSTHIAADSTGLYYASDFTIQKCALDTCNPKPTQLWDNGNGQYVDNIAVSASNLYFFGENNNARQSVYRCPSSGCTTPSQLAGITLSGYDGPFVYSSDVYFGPAGSGNSIKHSSCTSACTTTETLTTSTFSGDMMLAADGTSIFVLVLNTGAVYKCPASGAGTCALSNPYVTLSGSVVGMGIQGTSLFFAIAGTSGYTNGSIKVCPTTAASCNPSTFIDKVAYPQQFTLDASGLYWWAQDENALKTCPISGCVNGQHLIASSITQVQQLTVQSGALYWVVPGSSQNTTQIMRVVF